MNTDDATPTKRLRCMCGYEADAPDPAHDAQAAYEFLAAHDAECSFTASLREREAT